MPRTGLSARMHTETGVLVVAYAALSAKLVFALVSAGSNDVGTFLRFGTFIRSEGLGAMYRADPSFNHLPLTALFCAVIAPLHSFPFWLRLPGIIADLVSVKTLLRLQRSEQLMPWWSLALLAASPVSILVSGFHGNIDPIMTMALVLAIEAVVNDRPVRCAVWLALAVNIKVAALLLAPLIVLIWWHRRRSHAFVPTFIGITLLGWAPGLIAAPREFVDQVLGYSSLWGSWGFTYLAQRTGGASLQAPVGAEDLSSLGSTIVTILKLTIIVSALALAWHHRTATGRQVWRAVALTWAVFFLFAPGIGPQYLVWLAPFVLVASPCGYALVTAASSFSLVVVYGITSQWHFEFSHFTEVGRNQWIPWTLPAWVAISTWALCELRTGSSPLRGSRH